MTKTIINLSSQNGIKNNAELNSDVLFTFRNIYSRQNEEDKVFISVLNAQIPYSFYNINIYNNVLNMTIDGVSKILNLTKANYNSSTLISEITAQLALQSVTDIAITYSGTTGKLTFTKTSGTFSINGASTISKVLGFIEGTTYNSVAQVITAPNPLNLLGILKIKIQSHALNTISFDSAGGNTNKNILAVLPIEVGNFGLIQYDNLSNLEIPLNVKMINAIDIQLYGDDGNLINFNGIDWSISLVLNVISLPPKLLKEIQEEPEKTEKPKNKKKEKSDLEILTSQ